MKDLSLAIAFLTLLCTAAIPVFIYALGRKGEKITRTLLSDQRRLLSAQRLDILVAQAEEMGDPRDVSQILQEAKELSNDRNYDRDHRNFDRVLEAYWRNPQTPLCGSVLALDRRGALITSQHLAAKLRGKTTWLAIRELTDFAGHSKGCGEDSFIASRVTDWLLARFAGGDRPTDTQIRDLLRVASDEMFFALLSPLNDLSRSFPTAARVNILAGVCNAYLDQINFFPKGEKSIELAIAETTEKSNGNDQISALLAEGLGSLLHRGRLHGLAERESDDCTIPADCCAALVVAVAGTVSFCNNHLAMRSLQNIPDMHINPGSLKGFKYDYEFGMAKYAQYQPEMLEKYRLPAS